MSSLTAREVDHYFEKAKRAGVNSINQFCDSCGRHGCGVFAVAYRQRELTMRHPDPGNICAACAAIHENIVGRIIADSVRHDA